MEEHNDDIKLMFYHERRYNLHGISVTIAQSIYERSSFAQDNIMHDNPNRDEHNETILYEGC